uniref:Microfibril associated protein 2 n=1 Tax=Leptobrachium leishanense TaxID=445787 RepID=A0A8C5MMA3_9ANUR
QTPLRRSPPNCREEQYPCTRLYSVHKPCKQCLNEICFYSLKRMYVINKEICLRTVCAHEELLRGKRAGAPHSEQALWAHGRVAQFSPLSLPYDSQPCVLHCSSDYPPRDGPSLAGDWFPLRSR